MKVFIAITATVVCLEIISRYRGLWKNSAKKKPKSKGDLAMASAFTNRETFFCSKLAQTFSGSWIKSQKKHTCVGSEDKWLNAQLLRSQGHWFNPHPRHIVASLNKTLCDIHLCLVEHKQAAIKEDKISSNNRNLGTGNFLSGIEHSTTVAEWFKAFPRIGTVVTSKPCMFKFVACMGSNPSCGHFCIFPAPLGLPP